MDFSFKCPYCTQPFEAERDLCGSTCNCPSCGQLFIVPDYDPSIPPLEVPQGTPHSGGVSAADYEAASHEIARLAAELQATKETSAWLEADLHAQKEALATRTAELEGARQEAMALAAKAESAAKGPGQELVKLRADFDKLSAEKAAADKKPPRNSPANKPGAPN